MSCSREIIKEITVKEFFKEKEEPHKWFHLKYHEMGNVVWIHRWYREKYRVLDIINDPMTTDMCIFLEEDVDDG